MGPPVERTFTGLLMGYAVAGAASATHLVLCQAKFVGTPTLTSEVVGDGVRAWR